MPGCWLKKGENEIIVLDLLGPEKATITGLNKPILDMLRAEAPMTHRKEGESLDLKNEKPVAAGALKAGNGWQEVKFDAPVKARFFCLEALNSQDGRDYAPSPSSTCWVKTVSRSPAALADAYADSEETRGGNLHSR